MQLPFGRLRMRQSFRKYREGRDVLLLNMVLNEPHCHLPVGKSWQVRGKLDGWEVAQHAREIEPDFPVVYMSGAAAADWTSIGVPNSIMLAKPFAPAQLLTAVSNLLNSATPTT